MKKIQFKTHILPHIVAVIVFIIISALFYYPVVFDNQELYQHDILQFKGSAQEIMEYREQTGEEPLWTNSMFSGMPAYLISSEYWGDLFRTVKRIHSLYLPHPIDLTFSCMLCFYICLIAFGVRPGLAVAGAIAFALSTFNIVSVEAGHNMKIWAVAYMPLVIAGIHLAFTRSRLWGFLLTAIAMALHLRTNHLQITYYLMFIVAIYGIVLLINAIKEKQLPNFFKTSVILIFAALLGFGSVFGKMWNVYEYGEYSTRSGSELNTAPGQQASQEEGLDKEYVFRWSSGVMESMTLLIPNFKGGASREDLGMNSNLAEELRSNQIPPNQIRDVVKSAPTYWGDQPFVAGAFYLGAVVVFLFILGLLVVEKPVRNWLLIATVLSIVLSWGSNFAAFNDLMYEYFPLYSKFRSVTMTLSIATVCMPLLGFIAVERLFGMGWNKEVQKQLLTATSIVGGICLLIGIFAGALFNFEGPVDEMLAQYPDWFLDALRDDRQRMMRTDAFRSFFFIVAAAATLYYFLKQKSNHVFTLILLTGLVFVDMWFVARRNIDSNDFSRNPERTYFAETEADQFIKQDQDIFRVYNLQDPFNEARTSYHHHSLGGYHGAKMRRYQDLISHNLSSETNKLISGLRQGEVDFSGLNTINMLNARYILAGDTRDAVIKNENAFGNAWFVSNIEKVNSPDEEIQALENTDLLNTAVVDATKFETPEESFDADGEINLVEYKPNYLRYQYNAANEGFAVFSEIYYPLGWKASIDGQPVEYLRANYILRAMEVPAGEHVIEFKFEPKSYQIGNIIMLVCSIIILLSFLGTIVYSLAVNKKDI